jgi:hypothetical protein
MLHDVGAMRYENWIFFHEKVHFLRPFWFFLLLLSLLVPIALLS